jgi:thymidylate synthase (FAD)
MLEHQIDKRFSVTAIARTPNPQTLSWSLMHQCYSEGNVADELTITTQDGILQATHPYGEQGCGEKAVKHLLKGHRGHYSPLEGPQITFIVGHFPHSVMQQATRHRHASFSVQSMRYSGQRIVDLAERIAALPDWPGTGDGPHEWHEWVEDVFYLRPVGSYTNRDGGRYYYSEEIRAKDLEYAARNADWYRQKIALGWSEEHARGQLGFDYRQHFGMSANDRGLMHLLDLRAKKDAQLEIQQLCDLIWPHFEAWMPEVAGWYRANRWGKARLSP